MAVPDYQSLMLPLLKFISDRKDHSTRELHNQLIAAFHLSESDLSEMLPSGESVFKNRTGWAKTYLKKAGLLVSPMRGFVQISDRGVHVPAHNPERIDLNVLKQFPEFVEFWTGKKAGESSANAEEPRLRETKTPAEIMQLTQDAWKKDLANELLNRIQNCSPDFFEMLVVELLIKMGYGGNRAEAGKRIGKTGDGGIDGIINEDRLGLDKIYIQAKRWGADSSVGEVEVRSFVGALEGKKATKGVFITTSYFTKKTNEYLQTISKNVILIDGTRLAELMIEHDVGVSPYQSYELKKLDEDYFEEE